MRVSRIISLFISFRQGFIHRHKSTGRVEWERRKVTFWGLANREMGARETLNRPEKVDALSKHREEPDCRIPIEVDWLACTEIGGESDAESGILGRGDTVEAAGSRHPCALQSSWCLSRSLETSSQRGLRTNGHQAQRRPSSVLNMENRAG